MSDQIGRVVESNSAATTILTGSLATGDRAGMSVTGVAFAGQQLGNVGTAFEGIFGTLTVNANGSFAYVLNNDDPDTNLIASGEEGTERFTITFELGGITQSLGVEIAVEGVDEAVRSFFQTSQPITLEQSLTLDADTYARFTGDQGYVNDAFLFSSLFPLNNFGSIFLDARSGFETASAVVWTSGFTTNNGRIAATSSNTSITQVTSLEGPGANQGVVTASYTGELAMTKAAKRSVGEASRSTQA